MPDWERLLISRVAQTGAVEKVVSEGILPEHFKNDDCRQVYESILDHARRWNTSPSFQAVKDENPTFLFELTSDSLDYLADGFVRLYKRNRGLDALRHIASELENPESQGRLEDFFFETGRTLSQAFPKLQVGRFSDMDQRIDQYHRRQFEGDDRGIPFGIEPIDSLTNGIQPSEYLSIVGWTGTGKSTLLQYFFLQAYMAGKTPLIFSMEMDKVDILERWDTMAVNFEMQSLRKGHLTEGELDRWNDYAVSAKQAKNDIIILDKIGRCTIDTVYSEISRYTPDLVGIDYVSLMDPPRRGQLWEEVTAITRGLKVIAQSSGVPIIGVAQTNIDSADGGAKLSNIAYSRSIAQDSDHVFGLHQDDEMRKIKRMELRHLKNRKGRTQDIPMLWDMERMYFTEWREGMEFVHE